MGAPLFMVTVKSSRCSIVHIVTVCNMAKGHYLKIIVRVKNNFKTNWGAPFIIAFMALLLGAAVSGVGSYWADTLAVFAFYALVVGVALQFACFLKYEKKVDDAETIS
jgi:hypothetical protein